MVGDGGCNSSRDGRSRFAPTRRRRRRRRRTISRVAFEFSFRESARSAGDQLPATTTPLPSSPPPPGRSRCTRGISRRREGSARRPTTGADADDVDDGGRGHRPDDGRRKGPADYYSSARREGGVPQPGGNRRFRYYPVVAARWPAEDSAVWSSHRQSRWRIPPGDRRGPSRFDGSTIATMIVTPPPSSSSSKFDAAACRSWGRWRPWTIVMHGNTNSSRS